MLVPRPADSLTPPIHLASLFLRGILHFGFLGRDPGALAGSRESKISTRYHQEHGDAVPTEPPVHTEPSFVPSYPLPDHSLHADTPAGSGSKDSKTMRAISTSMRLRLQS